MEALGEFRVVRPTSVAEAVAAYGDGARYLAGGTDLLVNVRRGIETPTTLIDLTAIDGLAAIATRADGGVTLGAGAILAAVAQHPGVRAAYPAVAEAAAVVAAATHREVATVGGNLCLDTRCVYYNQSEWWRHANLYCLKHKGETCHVAPSGQICFAAFSGDLAPALMVFAATVDMAGPAGARTLALDDLYQDDGRAHLLLEPGEIVTAVHLAPPGGLASAYAKIRVRDAIDFPLVGAAVALKRDGDALADLRVALTGTNSRPLRLLGTEALCGRPLDTGALVKLLPKQIQPMSSTTVAPGYRRKVIANLVSALAERLYGG